MGISGGEVLYGAYNDALNYDLNKFRAEVFAEQVKNNYDLGLKNINLGQQRIGLDKQRIGLEQQRIGLEQQRIGLDARRVDLEARRVAQLELLNRMQGADPATADMAVKTKMEALQNALLQQQEQNKLLQGSLHLKTLNEAITKIADGDITSADRLIQTTPTLKRSLEQHFGVSKLVPIDFNNPEDKQALTKLGVQVDKLTPEAKEAMKRVMFKSYTPEGKLQVHSLPDLVKELNFDKKATTDQINAVTKAINTYKQAMSGTTDTPAEVFNEYAIMAEKIAKTVTTDPAKQEEIMQNLMQDVEAGHFTSLEDMVNKTALSDEDRARLMSQLKPADPKQIKANADAQIAVLKAKEEMNKVSEQEEKKQAKKIYAKHYTELMDSPQIWDSDKFDPAIYKVFEHNEAKGATTNDTYKKLKGKVSLYKQLKKSIIPKVEKALKDKNFMDQAKLVVKEYFKYNDKDKALKEYKGANQEAMNAVLTYVNALSGQSFTDEQIKRIKDVVGYNEWKTGNANIAGIKNFSKALEGLIKEDMNVLKPDYPASVYKQAVEFNKVAKSKTGMPKGKLSQVVDDLFVQSIKFDDKDVVSVAEEDKVKNNKNDKTDTKKNKQQVKVNPEDFVE